MITPEARETLRKIVEHVSKIPVEKLPELLVHNDSNIRKFAQKKFEALKSWSSDKG